MIHYPFFGGPHNQVLQLREPLADLGWENPVVLPQPSGSAGVRLGAAGCEVHEIKLHRLRAVKDIQTQVATAAGFPGDLRRLRSVIKSSEPDVVVLHGVVNPHAAIAARLEHVPIVWQVLDTRTPDVVVKAVRPLIKRWSDVVMSTGMSVAEMHGIPAGTRLVSYFPPVDTTQFSPAHRDAARAQLEADGKLVIGMVANLNPQKGHRFFIEAASRVAASNTDVRFVIIGAEFDTHLGYARELRSLVRDLGLSNRFEFIDVGSKVSEFVAGFDLFVLSSERRSEGIPTAMLEAMSAGVPVVAADVGSVAEAVADSSAATLVTPEDVEALAGAISRRVADPDSLRRAADAARLLAIERFDAVHCAAQHVKAFDLARRRGTPV